MGKAEAPSRTRRDAPDLEGVPPVTRRPPVPNRRTGRAMLVVATVLAATLACSFGAGAASAAPAAPVADNPARLLPVMTFNIHHGVGLDGRLDLARVAAVIRASGAEVIALQEVDRHYGERSAFAD